MKRALQTIIAFTLLLGAQTSFSQDIDLQSLVGEYTAVQYFYIIPTGESLKKMSKEEEQIDTTMAKISVLENKVLIDVDNGAVPLRINKSTKGNGGLLFSDFDWSTGDDLEITAPKGLKYPVTGCNSYDGKVITICYDTESDGPYGVINYVKIVLTKK